MTRVSLEEDLAIELCVCKAITSIETFTKQLSSEKVHGEQGTLDCINK